MSLYLILCIEFIQQSTKRILMKRSYCVVSYKTDNQKHVLNILKWLLSEVLHNGNLLSESKFNLSYDIYSYQIEGKEYMVARTTEYILKQQARKDNIEIKDIKQVDNAPMYDKVLKDTGLTKTQFLYAMRELVIMEYIKMDENQNNALLISITPVGVGIIQEMYKSGLYEITTTTN